jgi:hypothetical protein
MQANAGTIALHYAVILPYLQLHISLTKQQEKN